MAPQLVFGTGVLGFDRTEFQDNESVTNLLSTLKQLGINRLDTAARYPPFNPGKSEQLIGEASEISEEFRRPNPRSHTSTCSSPTAQILPRRSRSRSRASSNRSPMAMRGNGVSLTTRPRRCRRSSRSASRRAGRSQDDIRTRTTCSLVARRLVCCPYYRLTTCPFLPRTLSPRGS
jgi:hypothetical protein